MARPLRLKFAGVRDRFSRTVRAYCLMGNRYRLLAETPDTNLSKGLRQRNGVYTQRFNRTYGRIGHVFQGRYKGWIDWDHRLRDAEDRAIHLACGVLECRSDVGMFEV